jgi:hypothetical protein
MLFVKLTLCATFVAFFLLWICNNPESFTLCCFFENTAFIFFIR